MVFFGVTGGIACGKSTVARRFASLGVPVVDADQLARDVVAPGTPGLAAIAAQFGESVLAEDGALDRKKLGELVFADDEKRRALNRITHPRIAEAGMRRGMELTTEGHPLACYEATLLVENGIADMFRPLVVVSASEENQVARVVARDGVTAEAALARIRAQLPVAEKVKAADFVIDSNGTEADTIARADEVLRALCSKVGVPVERYGL